MAVSMVDQEITEPRERFQFILTTYLNVKVAIPFTQSQVGGAVIKCRLYSI